MAIDELNNDNFDHGPLGFFGGGSTRCAPIGAAPILTRPIPPGTPRWGSAWKKATVDNYLSAISVGCESSSYSNRNNFLDLDPTYTDRLGLPFMRITFDFPVNDLRYTQYGTANVEEIVRNMVAYHIMASPEPCHWS